MDTSLTNSKLNFLHSLLDKELEGLTETSASPFKRENNSPPQ